MFIQRLYHCIFYLFFAFVLNAQDLHFSNYQYFSSYFNPATTGLEAQDLTIGFQYRSQWANIPDAYRTFGINMQKRNKNFAWGGLLHSNGAGAASLKTTGGLFTTSFFRQLAKGDNYLVLGAGLGFIQRRFNPQAFSFDAQYFPETGYNLSNDNREDFLITNNSKVDFTVGLTYMGTLNPEKNNKFNLGFALAHVHTPDVGFLEKASPLPVKFSLHGDLDLAFSSKSRLQPHFLYQRQGVHKSFVLGFNMNRHIKEDFFLQSGLALRFKDALVFKGGLDWANKSLVLTYDLNNSDLSSVTQGRGAFELSFRIRLENTKKRKKRVKDRDKDGIYDQIDKCPDTPGEKAYHGCPTPEEREEEEGDLDGDGVLDKDDNCPYIPGYKHLYGCPDADKDGVIDKLDGCPNLPGSIQNHGCPMNLKDTDKDGVPDSEDYCVYLHGKPEFRGCPDSDKDGVSDIDDNCPYLKGLKQNFGCPGEEGTQRNTLDLVIEFATNEYYIDHEYKAELDFLVMEFQTLTNHVIMISGHTDSEGNDAFNHSLGQKRAFSVMKYLMSKGIPPSKIKTISYGEARPKRENGSDFGKAKNRRAEVSVVQQ